MQKQWPTLSRRATGSVVAYVCAYHFSHFSHFLASMHVTVIETVDVVVVVVVVVGGGGGVCVVVVVTAC